MHASWIEQRAGDLDAWEACAARRARRARELGRARATTRRCGRLWPQCLYAQDRLDEVSELCASYASTSPRDDLVNFIYARCARGLLAAREGRFDEAEAAARSARQPSRLAETTDFVFIRAQVASLARDPRARRAARRRLRELLARGARDPRREGRRHCGRAAARAPRTSSASRSPDRRRRTLLTSLHGDRVSAGGDRAPHRARAEVRQGRAHVRRCPAPSGRVARPPERRLDDLTADAVDLAEHPRDLGRDGHGDRGAPRDRTGARGRSRDRPPQPLDRRSGRGGRQGEALGVGDDRRARDASRERPRRRRPRAHGALPDLRRADHRRRRRPRRDPHEPRPPLRDRHLAARLGAHDEQKPRHCAGRHDARGGRGDPPSQQDREAAGRRSRGAPHGSHHGQGHLEADQVPGRDEGRAGSAACRGGGRSRVRRDGARSRAYRRGGRRARRGYGARSLARSPGRRSQVAGRARHRAHRGEHLDRRRRARARRRRSRRGQGRPRARARSARPASSPASACRR